VSAVSQHTHTRGTGRYSRACHNPLSRLAGWLSGELLNASDNSCLIWLALNLLYPGDMGCGDKLCNRETRLCLADVSPIDQRLWPRIYQVVSDRVFAAVRNLAWPQHTHPMRSTIITIDSKWNLCSKTSPADTQYRSSTYRHSSSHGTSICQTKMGVPPAFPNVEGSLEIPFLLSGDPKMPSDCGAPTGVFYPSFCVSHASSHITMRVQTGNIGDKNLTGMISSGCDSNDDSGHARRNYILLEIAGQSASA
jgi:hypothetical protein